MILCLVDCIANENQSQNSFDGLRALANDIWVIIEEFMTLWNRETISYRTFFPCAVAFDAEYNSNINWKQHYRITLSQNASMEITMIKEKVLNRTLNEIQLANAFEKLFDFVFFRCLRETFISPQIQRMNETKTM